MNQNFILQSRVHALNSFNRDSLKAFVKRDDELGCLISGSKLRKYSSLIPFLLEGKYKEVIVIGSFYSNHVLGITQLLIENNIRPILFLLESKTDQIKGNALLIQYLVDLDKIHWIKRQDWKKVEELAVRFSQSQTQKTFVLPEGAFIEQALPGAMTLATDIKRNEEDLGLLFDHIFIDSGTGLSAIGLLLGLAKVRHKAHVHIVLMADNESLFIEKLHRLKSFIDSNQPLLKISFYYPEFGKSFGSTSATTFHKIKEIAQAEGFFCDPIYTVKLFTKAKSIIETDQLKGNLLLIHSGGAHTLLGFNS